MTNSPFARAVAAIATPFRADLSVDFEHLIGHAHWLFENGCDGIVLFGTTGEAASLALHERKTTLERLLAEGISADSVVVGTGCCAVADTVELTRHAGMAGTAGALVLPPYFYKGISDAGIARYYDRVIADCGALLPPLYLYHIPQVSGLGISPDLVGTLVERHGDKIRGYKDSSGSWSNSQTLLNRYPALDVYVGSETLLLESLRAGGAGCISAGVNVQPREVGKVVEHWQSNEADSLLVAADDVRKSLEKAGPLIPAIKAVLARIHGHEGWAIPRPPLEPLPAPIAISLLADLRRLGIEGA
jgi:4-hydroxy-tetrahydrodipicolinate synthase